MYKSNNAETYSIFSIIYRLFTIVIIVIFMAQALAIFLVLKLWAEKDLWEMPLWIIPICLMLNVFLFWLFLKRIALRTFIFLYAEKFFPNREMRIINGISCRYYTEVLLKAKEVISSCMLHADYKSMSAETDHISGSESLEKLVEMLERYSQANHALIDDHDRKVSIKRKTSRQVPDRMFRDATILMRKMRAILN